MSDIKFAVRVDRARKGSSSALMFFNLNIGYTDGGEFVPLLVGTDFVLMAKKAGGYFFKGPSKQRIRNGEAVKKDGYNVYDEMVKMYGEEGDGGKFGLTKLSNGLRENIIKQATEAYEALGSGDSSNAARGSAAKQGAATSTGAGKGGDIFAEGSSEEELPF
jgi:hypothetical protein